MKAPRCPKCGRSEWHHLCGGAPTVERVEAIEVERRRAEVSPAVLQAQASLARRRASGKDPGAEKAVRRKGSRAVGGQMVAPPGECEYCDRRRAATAERMRKLREGVE